MADTETCKPCGEQDEPKKNRKRQKKVCADIRKQMEFYFSDANLHKDRFLKQAMNESKDGYIELSLFAKFNKLRMITEDMALVAKALSTCDLLQVSEDKMKVKRMKPLAPQKDVDDRTIYVECLPAKANHDWVKGTFESCGTVVYVSLPTYKSTRDIKGFAFVEFETTEGAKKACEMMNNPPANAADRAGKFPRANKQMKQLERQLRTHSTEGESRDPRLARKSRRQRTVSESAVTEDDKNQKRRRTTSDCADAPHISAESDSSEPTMSKRVKLDPSINVASTRSDFDSKKILDNTKLEHEALDNKHGDSRKRKLSESNSESSSESEFEQPTKDTAGIKKVRISEDVKIQSPEQKKIKRSRKRSKKAKETPKVEVPELRVITKHEWVSLKNEYLQLQKASMQRLKTTLREHIREHVGTGKRSAVNKIGDDCNAIDTSNTKKGAAFKGRQIEFTPNVIVKVTGKAEFTRKEVKEHALQLAAVVYVDLKDGATDGFIRCQNAEEAAKLIIVVDETYAYTLLEGNAEKEYWAKIHADQEQKLNTKTKSKRGRDKIFRKAEKVLQAHNQQKHVVFDDD